MGALTVSGGGLPTFAVTGKLGLADPSGTLYWFGVVGGIWSEVDAPIVTPLSIPAVLPSALSVVGTAMAFLADDGLYHGFVLHDGSRTPIWSDVTQFASVAAAVPTYKDVSFPDGMIVGSAADGQWHKFQITSDGFFQDAAQSATAPF